MTARESTNSFWGLVQQKGPWKETAQDQINARSSRGYYGKYDRVARPYVQGFMPPAPAPTAYSMNAITTVPAKMVFDPVSQLERQYQQQLLKTYGMDQQMALYPKAGNFSRSGTVLDAYAPMPRNMIPGAVQNGLNYGDRPVQNPGAPVIHTEILDYVMDDTTDSGTPATIPVFNGADMYDPDGEFEMARDEAEHPMGPEPSAPYPREPVMKRPNSSFHKPGKKIKPTPKPTKSGLGKRKPSVSHPPSKRVKPDEPEHKPEYKVPGKSKKPPIRKKKRPLKRPSKDMVAEDIAAATVPAIKKDLKRKGDKLELTGKVVITKDIRGNKRKAPSHNSKPGKKQKSRTTVKERGGGLKVRITSLPDSKQSHTKKAGVRAEDKSAAGKSSNLPTRKLR